MDIKAKIKGCFIGKNIGGTLGAIYESVEYPLNLTYYDPVPQFAMPNDDLELQLVWLEHFEEKGLDLDCRYLAQAWQDHIDFHPDEYGVALGNIRKGLDPPLTGLHNNYFGNGMGASIRSEIWASLFPGKPLTAAYFAYHDACVDHWGDGVYAEMFFATAESLMYVEPNTLKALHYGLKLLPDSSKLKQAITAVFKWHEQGLDALTTREMIMKSYGSNNVTDCIMNVCFIILGLLYGEGDFEKSLLLAVNCGYDTDCTGATIGAFLGIAYGEQGIPEKWQAPIGTEILISDYIKNLNAPRNINDLVSRIEKMRSQIDGHPLPETSNPFCLPEIQEIDEKNTWKVNGKTLSVPGMTLKGSEFPVEDYKPIIIETQVVFEESMDLQMMVCAATMFRTLWNGKDLGFKGDLSEMVPCFNRIKGGRIFVLSVEKGRVYNIKIELRYTLPIPDVVVAFADMNNRHLSNFNYCIST